MRATTLVASVGLPAYVIFMVLVAPASFIANRVTHATESRAHFSELQGTLWSGSMRAHIDAPGGAVTLDRVGWRLVPSKLVEGRIAFDVAMNSRDATGSVRILRGWSAWEARGGQATLDARSIPALLPIAAAWRPEGRVTLSADELRWTDREMNGSATAEWRDAAIALSDVRPLGSYRLAIEGIGDTARLALSTISGPLSLGGRGETKLPGGATTFSGEARGEGPSAAALEPLLNLMGPKRPDGARSIEVRIR